MAAGLEKPDFWQILVGNYKKTQNLFNFMTLLKQLDQIIKEQQQAQKPQLETRLHLMTKKVDQVVL
jgi:hypothetical protein